MPVTCDVTSSFFGIIMHCIGSCPPGANDKCTLQYRIKAVPPGPWKNAGRWRIRRWAEEYRCQCLRPPA